MLLYKILDDTGAGRTGDDAAPFSYFSSPIPTSSTYQTRTLYQDVTRRWSDDTTGLEVVQPQKQTFARLPEYPPMAERTGIRDSIQRFPTVVSGPVATDHYWIENDSDMGNFRRAISTRSGGGFLWWRVDGVQPPPFGYGTATAATAYGDLVTAQAYDLEADDGDSIGWAGTPVIAIATAEVTDAYREHDPYHTAMRLSTLEVVWHSRLDAAAEALIPAMEADRAAAIAARNAYLANPTPGTWAALVAAVVAFNGVDSIGGSGGAYREAVIDAAKAYVDSL